LSGPAIQRLVAAHLYAITPDLEPERVLELAGAVLRGGADVLQLRHKQLARGPLLELAHRLRQLTADAGAVFIVNDHVDIALLAGADGVHLGEDDLSPAEARRLGPAGFLVGVSANTPDAARAAVAAGADHLGCGPAFATPVKAAKAVIGPDGVLAVERAVEVPVFAIGGIDPSNLGELLAKGIRRACMIRGLSDAPDPEAAAREAKRKLTTQ
jgi:thiamine-phosphate pyrophosphorylase